MIPSLNLENRCTSLHCGVLGGADGPGLAAEGQVLTSHDAGLLEPIGLAGTAASQEDTHKTTSCL